MIYKIQRINAEYFLTEADKNNNISDNLTVGN